MSVHREVCGLRRVGVLFIACAASALRLSAQVPSSTARDSVVALTFGVRGWRGPSGSIGAPVAGTSVSSIGSLFTLRGAINLTALDARTGNSGTPRILDGLVSVTTRPEPVGWMYSDLALSLDRDASDQRWNWAQQRATLRTWIGTDQRGVAMRATASRSLGAGATPTATEWQLTGWLDAGSSLVEVAVRRLISGRLRTVGSDSAQRDLSVCQLDYDPLRPVQQFRTVCPEQLQSVDIGVGSTWALGRSALRVVAAQRILGVPASDVRRERWASVFVNIPLLARTSLDISVERRPTDLIRGSPAHGRFTVGVTLFQPAGLRTERPRAPAPSSRDGLAVEVDAVESVEARGDFSGWLPVTLTHESGTRLWHLRDRLNAGVHSVSIRIDGGEWIAPPGWATTDDGFGGRVGVIVIPS